MIQGCKGQISLFDFLEPEERAHDITEVLSIGDKIGRVVLGECRIATITKVEGLPLYPFYRTDSGGCYSYEEGKYDIQVLLQIAEKERSKYRTIIPQNLEKRLTVEYEPRACDGKVLWAQIGIIDNMLFWKEDYTYQFLEPYNSKAQLLKEYEKHKKQILERGRIEVKDEKPMRRLYWSRHGFYADAEYVHTNG